MKIVSTVEMTVLHYIWKHGLINHVQISLGATNVDHVCLKVHEDKTEHSILITYTLTGHTNEHD